MKVEIKIPTMGETVTEAVIANILQPSGSIVALDQDILELETEKVNQVLHAPQAGKVFFTVKVGDHVKIGQVVGSIDTDVKGAPTPVAPAPKASPAPVPAPATGPSLRKMAPEFVAELQKPAAPSPTPQAPPTGKTYRKRMSTLRKTIAQKLVEVKNTTAMLTTFNEVDMSAIVAIRAKEKESFTERYGVRLGFMSFFVKACVSALKAFPAVNSYLDGDDIVYYTTYDIGVAVSTDRGLLVPVIKNCDELSFGQIEQAIADYAKKARDGNISMDSLRGGSFSITNAGVFGSLLSTPILNPPQCGIFAMHNIVKRPVVVDDEIVIRPMMYIALSYDHRIVDGKEAVQFLVHAKTALEDPTKLLILDF